MIGVLGPMAEYINTWEPYFERSLADNQDFVIDDPIVYGNNIDHYTVTVYSINGRVSKYWNARILKDRFGYCRIACPRDNKILWFNWVNWTAYMFSQSGLNELVFMPGSRRRTISQLAPNR